MKDDVSSLSHSTWNCKYHIVFAPKYRKKAIYGQIKRDIGKILRQLCEYKEVKIIETEACSDHLQERKWIEEDKDKKTKELRK